MTNTKTLNKGAILFALALISIPTSSYAGTYAFVNTSDEVSMIVSNTSSEAIKNGLNIALHSGVMLLDSANIGIVGTKVNN